MIRNKIRIKSQDNFSEQLGTKNIIINKIVFYQRNKKIEIICAIPSVKDLKELDIIYKNIKKNFEKEFEFNFEV